MAVAPWGMKIFGYDVDDGDEREGPRTLRESTLLVTAAELRDIARFLLQCADEIDVHGERFGHEHLCDFLRPLQLDADLIVARAG